MEEAHAGESTAGSDVLGKTILAHVSGWTNVVRTTLESKHHEQSFDARAAMTSCVDQSRQVDLDHPLAPIMAFLGSEIDRSSTMLRDLAECLSNELFALSETGDVSGFQPNLSKATQALQNEDRIQQRLSDLRRALLVLEQALETGVQPAGTDLNRLIIDQFRLDEIRDAYATNVGIDGQNAKPAGEIDVPSAGDVDLF